MLFRGKTVWSDYRLMWNSTNTLLLSLEKEMATPSSILAWKIPWTEEPGKLQSMWLQRVWHDWATFTSLHFVALLTSWADCFSPGELALCPFGSLLQFKKMLCLESVTSVSSIVFSLMGESKQLLKETLKSFQSKDYSVGNSIRFSPLVYILWLFCLFIF